MNQVRTDNRTLSRALKAGPILILCSALCSAQPDTTRPNWGRTSLVASNLPVGLVVVHVMSVNRDKNVQMSEPHWRPGDFCYSQRFDIAGNGLYCYFLTRSLRYGYGYAGFSPVTATMLSGVNIALLHGYLKYRESLYWGTEPHDLLGAWAGIGFAILQSAYPGLERIQYKWLYNNSHGTGSTKYQGPFLENYEAQRFFLSVRLGDFLFDQSFLRGFGLCFGGGLHGDGTVRNYFGLDYDIRVLLPNVLGELLNYIHIPLPAVWYDGTLRFGLSL